MAACYSLAEYDGDVIKKHERTRKGQRRRPHAAHRRAARADRTRFSGVPSGGARSTSWRATCARRISPSSISPHSMACAMRSGESRDVGAGVRRGVRVGRRALHCRRASSRGERGAARDAIRDSEEANSFLAVAFPSDQLRILPYNRVVRDLKGMTPEHFLGEVARDVCDDVGSGHSDRKGPRVDVRRGQVAHGRSRERRVAGNGRHRHAGRQRAAGAAA